MKTIVCVDNNWGIGSNNDLLYHLPADMRFFKEQTTGNVVIMGMATVLSLPGGQPLKDRMTIALSDDPEWRPEGATVCGSIPELLEAASVYDSDRVFVCGGASVYAQLLDYCDTALVTKVNAGDKEAEKFFPNLDEKPEWFVESESEPMEHKGIEFRFVTYKRISDE